ncbi:hypothetical protein KQX54_008921 [Cotesia glomerata]|uniref:Uncharacterized protein n=1 Tax=Cotesia glomerata TaxID=32391 RepID=A0AAV7IGZ4_COTGL|nr:hypothetical protein KQX54_008921 [Cotesia glomerata]
MIGYPCRETASHIKKGSVDKPNKLVSMNGPIHRIKETNTPRHHTDMPLLLLKNNLIGGDRYIGLTLTENLFQTIHDSVLEYI